MIQTTITNLNHRQNVLLQALPGMGLNNATQKICHHLRNQPNTLVLNIYPHESAFDNYSHLEALIISKLKIENYLDTVSSIVDLYHYLTTNSIRLIIVLNKLQEFVNPTLYLDFVDSLYGVSPDISVLITSNFEIYSRYKLHQLIISCQPRIFPGYISDFDQIMIELKTTFGYTTSDLTDKTIFSLSLGHTGLIKTLLQISQEKNGQLNSETLLDYPLINQRLAKLFQSLEIIYPNLTSLFQNHQELTSLGLMYQGHLGLLYHHYFQKHKTQPDLVLPLLTVTEKEIYQFLLTRTTEYSTIDQLLLAISPSAFDTKSDWTIYKHLNNLNKKLQPLGKTIVNHRSKGYQLCPRQNGADTAIDLQSPAH